MKFVAVVQLYNNFCDANYTIYGDNKKYIEYLENKLEKTYDNKTLSINIDSREFDKVKVTLDIQYFIGIDNKTTLLITFEINDKLSIDSIYEKLENDVYFLEKLMIVIKNYLYEVNNSIKAIKFLKEASIAFNNEKLFVEIPNECDNIELDWTSFKIDDTMYATNIIDNLYI